MNIYIAQNEQQTGPFTLEEVNEKLMLGNVLLTDLAWHEGMSDWQALSTIKGVINEEILQNFRNVQQMLAAIPVQDEGVVHSPSRLSSEYPQNDGGVGVKKTASEQKSLGAGGTLISLLLIGGLIFGVYWLYNFAQDSFNKSVKISNDRELRINDGSLELWRDGKYLNTVYKHLRASIDGGLISENIEKVEPIGDGEKYAVVLLKVIASGSRSSFVVKRVEICDLRDGSLPTTLAMSASLTNEKPIKGIDGENDDIRAAVLLQSIKFAIDFDNETTPEERKKKMPEDFTVHGEDEVKIKFADGTETKKRIEK
ncbi:MAG: DUF4339 domain-containing protein [Candidatus Kapaibacterium sp.]|nr:MAG: DUF4339 domain-containing protein [Candidatus Kapabacteria bacterium]